MKWYLIPISLLLLLAAGCVGVAEPPAPADPLIGTWVHDDRYPIFLFSFEEDGQVNIAFMGLEDPGRPGYTTVVPGRWEAAMQDLAITYTAPVSGNVITLRMIKTKDLLVLESAVTADGEVLNIEDLAGIRFVRGESYSAPLMGDYQVDIL